MQQPIDIHAVDEHVVARSDAFDVDVLALLGGYEDVAPADGGALEHAPSARFVPGAVAPVGRVSAAGAPRPKRRTVPACQAEAALVIAEDSPARQRPELVPFEGL